MDNLLDKLGLAAGCVGAVLTIVAGAARVLGHFTLMDYQAITILEGGSALMILAIFIRLYLTNND